MPSTAALAPPRSTLPVRHQPRRGPSATGVLRAIGTGLVPVVMEVDGDRDRKSPGSEGSADSAQSPATVRSLRLRDITTGGAAAAGSWTLAAHLGVLGTAGGTFIVSALSTVLMALATDSLTGGRRVLLRTVQRARQARVHRPRR